MAWIRLLKSTGTRRIKMLGPTGSPSSSCLRHRWLAIFVAPLVLAAVYESPAMAAPLHYIGNAPGSIACSLTFKVKFSPRLKMTGGGTGSSRVKGVLFNCQPSDSAVTISKATAVGSFASSPLSCTTLSATGAAASLTITWKGTLNGTVASTEYSSRARFTSTTVSGSEASGSFGGAASIDIAVPAHLSSLCEASRGLRKTTISGTMTLGETLAAGSTQGKLASDGEGYCAVLASTGVACWGLGTLGELGNGLADSLGSSSEVPVAVLAVGGKGTLTGVADLTGGYYNYCAVLISGGVDCWGDDTNGQLGNGVTGNGAKSTLSPTPTPVLGVGGKGTLGGVARVTSTQEGYCAVLISGGVDCWGEGTYGALGDGKGAGNTVFPVQVVGLGNKGLLGDVDALTSALASTYCALMSSGLVACWGQDDSYQLGVPGGAGSPGVPVLVDGAGGSGILSGAVQVEGGSANFCALLNTGGVVCWGDNYNGSTGSPTDSNTVPDAVVGVGNKGLLKDTTALETDTRGFCALLSSEEVDCWGDNADGELGGGSIKGMTSSWVPVAVVGVGASGVLAGVSAW